MNLISPLQVNRLAFWGTLREEQIPMQTILIAQERYLAPRFEAHFEVLVSGEEPYAEFLNDYLRPALAEYVKLELLPHLAAQAGSSGVVQFGGIGNSRPATDVPFERLAKITARNARALFRRAVRRAIELKMIKPAPKPDIIGGMLI